MAEKKEKLFDQFPGISYDEWRAKVETDLKGADFNKKLVWRTNEGFNVQPIYRAEDIADLKTTDSLPGEYPFIRGTRTDNEWLTRQEILSEDPAEANKTAIEVLGKGVNSLGFKVAEPTEATVTALLDGIDLEKVEINFNCCPCKAMNLAEALVNYLKAKGAEKSFHGSIDFNPLRKALRHGAEINAEIVEKAIKLIKTVESVPSLRVLAVDSVFFCDGGAYIFQELGYALAWGAQWMTALTDAGLSAEEVADRIKFNMGVSSNYFMELAKFRAARMLWAQIVEQYKPDRKSVV